MEKILNSKKRSVSATAIVLAALALGGAAVAQEGSFGDKIPLELAMRQIVPEGHKVQIEPGVDGHARVSWKGEGSWRQSAATAAQSAGYVAVVNGDTVRVMRAGAVVEKVAEVKETKKEVREERVVRKERPAPRQVERRPIREKVVVREEVVSGGGFVLLHGKGKAAPEEKVRVASADEGEWKSYEKAAPVAPVPQWVVAEGQSLHAVLADWAAREGWRLVWKSEYEYRLTSAARFGGDFVTATTELMRSMSSARPVVTVKFFQGNKTLVVGNDSSGEAN